MVRLSWLALTFAAAMLFAASAAAQDCKAPPGTSAVDEYCETIPSATGDKGAGSSAARPVPRSTARALEHASDDGKRLNRFLAQDPRAPDKGSKRVPGPSKDGRAAGHEVEPSSNPLKAIQSAVSSGDTVGNGFAWIVLGVVVFVLGVGWVRYRRQLAE
jgi:hypothetical protein